ncbi:TadE/TadG family type IV pilus assembly protein [Flavimaricola marinus]|uniref:TadE-like protein n=1 Tax=Flavimaricola marinus TaxID=1819565 RepID=A0A238LFU0_9RHOB|nr:hypothetical protein [Flavimaricola marinus]SMY08587.1 hypothetical protein LOM8899_02741 [Flavimaricola marinus]
MTQETPRKRGTRKGPLGWASRALRRIRRSEDGSVSVEAVCMLPLMIWAFLGMYVFYDAYRAQFVNTKAGYTLGDILSRETTYITPEYLDSLYDLQRFLVDRQEPIRLRLTVISYDQDSDSFNVRWSQNRGGGGVLTTGDLPAMRHLIPDMADGSVAVVVQTSMEYKAIYGAGIGLMDFDDIIVTRPRFAGQLCWNSVNTNPTQATATC